MAQAVADSTLTLPLRSLLCGNHGHTLRPKFPRLVQNLLPEALQVGAGGLERHPDGVPRRHVLVLEHLVVVGCQVGVRERLVRGDALCRVELQQAVEQVDGGGARVGEVLASDAFG
eukprot:CAMPEP_0206026044 /NCGR_PEP_ID=MMETSP1464-20131121/41086_1 /ASSEMBLY_ACC=CAM_ASM_001124 /TAXON_ID=119497 /ORGANISM="Exanthemachrysis gayraliae, Strain RCC1523" /LENGTH=115 /DNA_ID=CAMNT_0053400085 /DNA_START=33 /DNA_END=378 /DNA_ORIENTATION=+